MDNQNAIVTNGKQHHQQQHQHHQQQQQQHQEKKEDGGGVSIACKNQVARLWNIAVREKWISLTGGNVAIRHKDLLYLSPPADEAFAEDDDGFEAAWGASAGGPKLSLESVYVLRKNANATAGRPFGAIRNEIVEGGGGRGNKVVKLSLEGDVQICDLIPSPLHWLPFDHETFPSACIHSHSFHATAVSVLFAEEFQCKHIQFVRSIEGHANIDDVVIPIVDYAPNMTLKQNISKALVNYPITRAVLIRRHGAYIWGSNWQMAIKNATAYHELFKAAPTMHLWGFDPTAKYTETILHIDRKSLYGNPPGVENETDAQKRNKKRNRNNNIASNTNTNNNRWNDNNGLRRQSSAEFGQPDDKFNANSAPVTPSAIGWRPVSRQGDASGDKTPTASPSPIVTPVPTPTPSLGPRMNERQATPVLKTSEQNDAKTVDLTKLQAEMEELVNMLLSKETVQHREKVREIIEEIVKEKWPAATVHMYGSSANGLCTRDSDLDMCVSISSHSPLIPIIPEDIFTALLSVMEERFEFEALQLIEAARVPILRFKHCPTQLVCEISVNNMLSIYNSRMIRAYTELDSKFLLLSLVIKYWSRRRLDQNPKTRIPVLSSYALNLMLIYFFQKNNPPLFPSLQQNPSKPRVIVGEFDCTFDTTADGFVSPPQHSGPNAAAKLLLSFFFYYGNFFKWEDHVVCPRLGETLSKKDKNWGGLVCVEDPFELSHDLGNRITDEHKLFTFKDELKRAYLLLNEGEGLHRTCRQKYRRNEKLY